MKQLRIITIIFTIIMLVVLFVFNQVQKNNSFTARDVASYNDMVYQINDEYKKGSPIEMLEEKYGCDIVLSTNLVDKEITKYYSSGALILDFAPDGDIIGKVVWDDKSDSYKNLENTLKKNIIIFWYLVLISGYIFVFIIYLLVVRPIKEFESFANDVAKGNLEVSLPRRRFNLFGNFTESFDQMREELKSSKQREAQADLAKREMIAGLSHDIKTPISSIQATCEVAEAKYMDDKDVMEKINIISSKTETINMLINNLLQSTMAELEELEINPTENSSEVIEEYFSAHKQSVKIIFDDQIPRCLIYIDPLRMEQAIDNVISNSIKYAGTDIHVGFSTVEGPKDEAGKSDSFIKIRIKDSGPGVPEDDLAMITEKYFRGSNAGEKPGYGLGMNLIKTYMEKQGGGLEYYNDGGFVVELLVKKV